MTAHNYFSTLNVSKDLKPLSATAIGVSDQTYYKGVIKPPLPSGTAEIRGDKLWYQSFTAGWLSLLGRDETTGPIKQLSLVLPEDIQDGSGELGSFDRGEPFAVIVDAGRLYEATGGKFTIKRNLVDNSITGDFIAEIQTETSKSTVTAKFLLIATNDI